MILPGPNAEADGGRSVSPSRLPSSVEAPEGLTDEEAAVWRVIPTGRAHAIKQSYLAAACFISVRRLQMILKSLTETHGLPVASACRAPMGSFVPATAQEVDDYVAQLKSRAVSCHRRISAVKASAASELVEELQAALPLGYAPEPEEACTVRLGTFTTCLVCPARFKVTRENHRCCSERCRMIWNGRASR